MAMTTVAEPVSPGPTAPGAVSPGPRRGFRERVTGGILGRGALSFVIATAGVNLSNFVFHLVMSRYLGPGHYSALGALLNIIAVVAVPIGAAQLAVTQAVVERCSDGRQRSLRRVSAIGLVGGTGAMLVFWALTPLLDAFLHLSSPLPLLLVGVWIPLATLGAVLQGALIGEYRFPLVAAASFLGGGPVRLALGVGLVALGLGVPGAVGATIAAQLFTTVVLLVAARSEIFAAKRRGGGQERYAVHASLRDAALSIAALGGYTALTGIDTFLARHFFSATRAGQYAAGAVAGHIALFLPGALVMIVFPRLVEGAGTSTSSRKALGEALGATVAVGLVAAAGIAVLPGLVVSVLFGASYRAAAGIVGLLALESAVLGTIGLLTYLQIARRSLSALWAWVGVGLAVLVISLDHPSLLAVVAAMLGAVVAVLVLLGIPTLAAVLRASAGEGAVPQQVEVAGEAELELSLVVPFYNPGPRLRAHVTEAVAVLEGAGVSFEILAVSDGSTDGCEEQLAGIFPGVVRTLRLPRNEGKGAALRTGLAIGRGEYLGFIDGDGDIPAGLLSSFVEVARRDRPDVVYGSKRHRDSKVIYPWQRRVYSWGYQSLTRALFSLPVRDTQTGVKLIRRDVVAAVLPRMVEKRFAFDLELLAVARRLGFRNFVELPVVIRERFSSTVSLGSVRDMLLDTAAIFYRLRVLRYYGPPVRRAAPGRLERAAPVRNAPEIGHALGSLSLDGSVMKGEQLA